MARYRCRGCGDEGMFAYTGKHECPNCGSHNVQFALAIEELGDDDQLIVALENLTDDSTERS